MNTQAGFGNLKAVMTAMALVAVAVFVGWSMQPEHRPKLGHQVKSEVCSRPGDFLQRKICKKLEKKNSKFTQQIPIRVSGNE
ncbi:hypothetical protein GW943_01125 [Candidatus Parcubacteria bacterium]|uniref:Uncharacterized protein n=1 Tax=Candidatus Kaiserbacteria bacterium CG10_big_fil_rev_8_21_14_0_10_47_16 TaxID=1974608 RepID=A0A2H0UDE0_9BACT|nr:hypothetical protein [Candidatus Parcubacteria bacterium]PIR84429.1 MAG: hypothetical protein COU16_02505 [Candidatus Kaiserbacteria bacterium CG10_big_fil_rev_8_21_14_0_10_47_16]